MLEAKRSQFYKTGQQAGDQGKSTVCFKSQQTQDRGRGKVSAQMQRLEKLVFQLEGQAGKGVLPDWGGSSVREGSLLCLVFEFKC